MIWSDSTGIPVASLLHTTVAEVRLKEVLVKIVKPVLMFLALLIPTTVLAQAQSERQGWGYGFVAFGGTAPNGSIVTFTYGAGGERLVYRDLAVGAELASISPIESLGSG